MNQRTAPDGLPFAKMHGLGNDFVVLDARDGALPELTPGLVRAIADRQRGVGFDQLAVVSAAPDADIALAFWNADGTPSATCGNATRCIARSEMVRTGLTALRVRTGHGMLAAEDAGNGLTRVNMGAPRTGWREIPLAEACDTDALPLEGAPTATSLGNPHCTFFVADVEASDLGTLGPAVEHHPLFPERTNVEVAALLPDGSLRVRVWERGTGITLASGSCATAAAVAAARRGLTGRRVTVRLDGGALDVDWRRDGVWTTGPTAHVFDGRIDLAALVPA